MSEAIDHENAIANYVGGGEIVTGSSARPFRNKKNAPRKFASNLERRGRQSGFHMGFGKRMTYARSMSAMVFDLIVNGETLTATGEKLSIRDVKQWTELVKFVHSHVDGPVFPNSPLVANVNLVKIYAGVNPDEI